MSSMPMILKAFGSGLFSTDASFELVCGRLTIWGRRGKEGEELTVAVDEEGGLASWKGREAWTTGIRAIPEGGMIERLAADLFDRLANAGIKIDMPSPLAGPGIAQKLTITAFHPEGACGRSVSFDLDNVRATATHSPDGMRVVCELHGGEGSACGVWSDGRSEWRIVAGRRSASRQPSGTEHELLNTALAAATYLLSPAGQADAARSSLRSVLQAEGDRPISGQQGQAEARDAA